MIGIPKKLVRDKSAAAAVEMALALPLLLVLIWGPLEIGNYFLDEHMLVKGVRDGATYLAHQDITKFDCNSGAIDLTVKAQTENMIRRGQVTGGVDRLRNWAGNPPTMNVTCVIQSDSGTALSGMYKLNTGGLVPVINIDATVPYSSIFGNLGFRPASLSLNAKQEATVMGI
ncbi:MAG TPA: TadE/TadG family type IV pilus assembly protein [Sphingomicrobium sp.]|nr:TadE/TadG family type IV pilus assembly protein [Sphingomicrobium sp.]